MKTFIAVVHKDEGSAFGVSFPDLPGCFSAANRMEDVLPNAVESLELWFEDAHDVDPRPMEVIAAEVAHDLAQGAFLLAVPRFKSERRPVRVSLTLDHGVVAAIDAAAAARCLTRSAFIARAARNEIAGVH